jgi:hypothetical protein
MNRSSRDQKEKKKTVAKKKNMFCHDCNWWRRNAEMGYNLDGCWNHANFLYGQLKNHAERFLSRRGGRMLWKTWRTKSQRCENHYCSWRTARCVLVW